MDNTTLKKIISIFLLALIIVGLLGGIGYAIWCKAYIIAIGIAVLGGAAIPEIKRLFKVITD